MKNCWEFKNCGRQPGGKKASELGVCPAAVEKRVNEANRGTNGGRACWVVAGTLCGGNVQGTFASKMLNCSLCEFYKMVREEEGADFITTTELIKRLS